MKLEELKRELDNANQAEKDAKEYRRRVEKAYASDLAENLGLGVGSIVTQTKTIGYGSGRKVQHRRYRVAAFGLGYGDRLTLFGRTIRKDGTDGERHELYGDWQLEPSFPSVPALESEP